MHSTPSRASLIAFLQVRLRWQHLLRGQRADSLSTGVLLNATDTVGLFAAAQRVIIRARPYTPDRRYDDRSGAARSPVRVERAIPPTDEYARRVRRPSFVVR